MEGKFFGITKALESKLLYSLGNNTFEKVKVEGLRSKLLQLFAF